MKNNMYYSRGKNLLIYFILKQKYLRWNENILYSFRIWEIFITFYSWIIGVNFFYSLLSPFFNISNVIISFEMLNTVSQSLLLDTGRRPVSSSQKLESVAARSP